jgi:hypothetical protein
MGGGHLADAPEGRASAHAAAHTGSGPEQARKGKDRQLLLEVILLVLADPSVPDEQVGGILRDEIGMQLLGEAQASRWTPLPADHGQLSALDASYAYLRASHLGLKCRNLRRIFDINEISAAKRQRPHFMFD